MVMPSWIVDALASEASKRKEGTVKGGRVERGDHNIFQVSRTKRGHPFCKKPGETRMREQQAKKQNSPRPTRMETVRVKIHRVSKRR
jgi:hypothetical protein